MHQLDPQQKRPHAIFMITSKITKRGQTTLPRQIRNALQVKAGQSIVYELTTDGVFIRAHPGAMASYGALRPKDRQILSYEQERSDAREEWVEHVAEEGRQK